MVLSAGAELPTSLLAGHASTHRPYSRLANHRHARRRLRLHPVPGHRRRPHAHRATGLT